MKNTQIHLFIISGFLLLGIISCKPREKDDSKGTAIEHNEAKANDSKEAKFLVDATDLSMREIELAKMAQQSNGSENIKKMGKSMESDHAEFLKELKKLAKTKSISIPEELSKNTLAVKKKLENKSDNDFDKEYCEIMVEGLKEEIKKFKSASEDIDDIDIKNWANKTLPSLRDHLDHAMTCKESHKNNMANKK